MQNDEPVLSEFLKAIRTLPDFTVTTEIQPIIGGGVSTIIRIGYKGREVCTGAPAFFGDEVNTWNIVGMFNRLVLGENVVAQVSST